MEPPTNSPLFKYKLGFMVLGLLTLGLVVFMFVQAGATKQDKKTTEAASEAATKINAYVSTYQKIPDSLSAAGVKNVPKSIVYSKLSDKQYQFCVTYKTAGTTLDTSTIVNGTIYPHLYGDGTGINYEDSSYLYLSNSHKKGKNCQTIKPYIYSYGSPYISPDTYKYKICDQSYGTAWSFVKIEALTSTTIDVEVYSKSSTFDLGKDVKVFSYDCKILTLADIKVGDTVDLYQDSVSGSSSEPIAALIKEY